MGDDSYIKIWEGPDIVIKYSPYLDALDINGWKINPDFFDSFQEGMVIRVVKVDKASGTIALQRLP